MQKYTNLIRNLESSNTMDNRRSNRVHRFQPKFISLVDDGLSDYMNLIGMLCSMCALMLKIKFCGWIALFSAIVGFANSRVSEDGKQVFSSFMLSASAIVITYMQNPAPMKIPYFE
ncbi:unnamed protein product [Rotaria magnacalcarata]|uniref:Protein Asterix n=3 Tax=Rotaria magnacalcarata TaxID=392030 RepID=A0A816P212_9BILA|nr:unnamed protein product [Rotaria magnacalcarata]